MISATARSQTSDSDGPRRRKGSVRLHEALLYEGFIVRAVYGFSMALL